MIRLDAHGRVTLVGQIIRDDVWLIQRPAVDRYTAVVDSDFLAGQADDALDEVAIGALRIFEHDDVAAADVAVRQDRALDPRDRRREDHLVHDQVIADGRTLVVSSASNPVRRLLEITGLEAMFGLTGDSAPANP